MNYLSRNRTVVGTLLKKLGKTIAFGIVDALQGTVNSAAPS